MKTSETVDGAVLAPSTVRYYRGRWLYTMDLEADEWNGCCKKLEDAMDMAFKDAWLDEYPAGTPIYFAHGRPAYKQECDDMGVDWPWYQVDPHKAITILLPNND